jgi:hypothetical protein
LPDLIPTFAEEHLVSSVGGEAGAEEEFPIIDLFDPKATIDFRCRCSVSC